MIRLRDKVVLFFAANPEEELRLSDVIAKWGGHETTTWEALRTMEADGLLSRVRIKAKGSPMLYRAGPLIKEALGAQT